MLNFPALKNLALMKSILLMLIKTLKNPPLMTSSQTLDKIVIVMIVYLSIHGIHLIISPHQLFQSLL